MTGQLVIKNNRTKEEDEEERRGEKKGKKGKGKKGKRKKGHASTRIRLDSSDGAEILDL